jgi:hypothetical protein
MEKKPPASSNPLKKQNPIPKASSKSQKKSSKPCKPKKANW